MDTAIMLKRAGESLQHCHCPYSRFRVAAVLEDSEGGLHTGVNIENASFGLTVCAERVALFSAVSKGKRDFRGMLVYSPDGKPLPCGACRQVLMEFCPPDMPVAVATEDSMETFTLKDLLPRAFGIGT
jgi:cytidine deaminase